MLWDQFKSGAIRLCTEFPRNHQKSYCNSFTLSFTISAKDNTWFNEREVLGNK